MAAETIEPYFVARELFPDQPAGFPYEGFELESLKLPDDDDMGVPSEDDEIEEEAIQAETGFGSVIVVSGVPVVPEEKFGRLQAVIERVFSRMGIIREGGFYMPMDTSSNMTKGFAFIEFISPQQAQEARKQGHGHVLDKNHTFSVSLLDDFEKYMRVPDVYAPPELKEYSPTENLHEYMLDKMGRDQFVIRHGDETAIYWNDGKRARTDEVYKRTFWTESYVQWSPAGSYLATIHRQGVALWGGSNMSTRLQRLSHPGVALVDFSPNESYLVTYSSQEPSNPRDSVTVLLNVFDVRSGRKLRVFQDQAGEFAVGATAGPGGALKWPIFKWAGGKQDLYYARLGKNVISVYTCPDMFLLDRKSIKLEGVHDFEWSPSEPVIAAYTTEQNNLPARISLIKIPERTELRQKNLFSVSEVKIFWHPQGDYLAVRVDRFTKTKKSTYTGFELFSVREKDIPMEVLELPSKTDKVLQFAWEPKGHRFCIVHGEGMARFNVSFYTMKDDKGRLGVKHIGTLPNKQVNLVSWSPAGRHLVLAGLKSMNGQLEFFSVDDFETSAAGEHFMCTDLEWDPTGRYLATSVTSVATMENGFNIWSFHGRFLYNQAHDRFYQFLWRPRLQGLLPADKEGEIVKNLKTYSKKYDEEDEQLLLQADADVIQERERLTSEWHSWWESKRDYAAQLEEFKRKQLGPKYDELEFTMESMTVEQTLDVKEEPYNAS